MKANINNTQSLIAAALCPSISVIEVSPKIGFMLYRAQYNEASETFAWYDYDNEYFEGRPVKVTTISEMEKDLDRYMAQFNHPLDKLEKAHSALIELQSMFNSGESVFCGDENQVIKKAYEKALCPIRSAIMDTIGELTMCEYTQQEFDKLIQDYLKEVEEEKNIKDTEVQILTRADLYRALKNGVDVHVIHMKGQMDLYLKDDQISMWGVVCEEGSIDHLLDKVGVYASFKLPKKYRQNYTEHFYPATHRDHCVIEVALMETYKQYYFPNL